MRTSPIPRAPRRALVPAAAATAALVALVVVFGVVRPRLAHHQAPAPLAADQASWARLVAAAVDAPPATEPKDFNDGFHHFIVPAGSAKAVAALDAMPETTVTRIDGQTVAVRTKATRPEVRARTGITTVTDDELIGFAATSAPVSDDPLSSLQWSLQNRGDTYLQTPGDMTAGADAHVPEAWARTRGAGVVVAVIDTRVDFSHPDLVDRLWTNPNEACGAASDTDHDGLVGDCHGWDFSSNSATDQLHPTSNQYHGSHVAGIIGATANNRIGISGIAPEVTIMPLAVGDPNNMIPLSAAAAAINYAVDHHASVINASWGGGGAMPSYLSNTIARAEAAGIVFVAAAGNNGADITNGGFFPGGALNSNVITVGASTANDTPASFSNYSATRVAVFAPGQYVLATLPMSVNGGYGLLSGTSMAAPEVTAEVALLRSLDPTLTASQVKDRIMATAKRLSSLSNKAASGARIDVTAAVGTVVRRGGPTSFNFDGFNGLQAAQPQQPRVQASLDATTASAHPNVSLTLQLAANVDGQGYAVADQPLTVTLPGGGQATVTTDDGGQATIPAVPANALVDGGDFRVDVELPAGLYALGTQLTDAGQPVGDPSRVVFEVATEQVAPAPTTTTPTTIVSAPPTTSMPAPPSPGTPGTTPPSPTPPGTTPPSPTPPGTTPPSPTPGTTPPSPTPTNPSPPVTNAPSPPGVPTPTTPVTSAPAPPPPIGPPPTNAATPPPGPPETVGTPTTPSTIVWRPAPPGTPRDLAAIAADGAVTLTWNAPDGEAVTGYRVYRDDVLIAQTGAPGITVSGLTNGLPYEFKVSAFTQWGESARTAPVRMTPSAPTTTRPSTTAAPTTVAATVPPTTPPTVPATTPPTTVPRIVEPPNGGRYVLTPSSGSVAGGTVISITGPGLNGSVGIEIDGAYAQVMSATSGWITAATAPHLTPGTYDVVLHRMNDDVVLTRAFTYVGNPSAPAPPGTNPPVTAPPVTNPPVTNPPVTNPPVPTPPVTSPPVTSPPVTSPPVTSPPATSPPVTAPAPPRLGNLRLAPMPPSGPLAGLPPGMWGGMTCRQPRCSG